MFLFKQLFQKQYGIHTCLSADEGLKKLDENKDIKVAIVDMNMPDKDGLMFIHPDANQARSITVKEAALIQSFPDDFKFTESMGYNYKMIGNAVPPVMAEKIAIAIADVILN